MLVDTGTVVTMQRRRPRVSPVGGPGSSPSTASSKHESGACQRMGKQVNMVADLLGAQALVKGGGAWGSTALARSPPVPGDNQVGG